MENTTNQDSASSTLLQPIWRERGNRFLCSLSGKAFKNILVNSTEDAVRIANELSASGHNAYFAMARYETPENRTAANAAGASGFWLDIDCGADKAGTGKGYASKKEAAAALGEFITHAGLPVTSHIVDSGNGLHIYWVLNREIPKAEWQSAARKLKSLTEHYGLLADPTRTADIASVLRVPGTKNWKDHANPKNVTLKSAGSVINADVMIAAIEKAATEYTKTPVSTLFPVERLSAKPTMDEPYPFEENRADFFEAFCIAYPDPSDREVWLSGLFILAYLVVVHGWPVGEVTKLREAWESTATDKTKVDPTSNSAQWRAALDRTAERVQSGESVATHRTVLKLARETGWAPTATTPDALQSVQQKYALISLGGKVGIIDMQVLDAKNADGTAASLAVMSRADGGLLVERFLSSEYPQVDARSVVAKFLRDKGTTLFSGVEFNPRATTRGMLNLWVGMTVKPRAGDWHLIRSLLRDVLCGGRDSEYQYLLRYVAHAIQRPEEKPGVMVILLGGQGIGKGTLARILQKIWSATFLHVHRIKQVVGDFNGSLERAYVVFLDEALFAGDRASSDALKSLVTEQAISINEKHQPSRQIRSFHRFFSATNADWFKSTDRDDRRDFVLRVSEHRKGDHEFWKALNDEIDSGGVEAFVHDLLAIDLSGFNVRAKPNTRELTEQKLQSLDKFPRWWFDCLARGGVAAHSNEWPEFVSTAALLSAFKEAEQHVRSFKLPIERDVKSYMGKLCPSAKPEQGTEGMHRRRGYRLPELEQSRHDFERYIGDRIEWEDS